MSPRTGRPTDDPKPIRMDLRISESDAEKLEYCRKMTGKSKGEIIRLGITEVYNKLKELEATKKD